jgi:hypothetical protein
MERQSLSCWRMARKLRIHYPGAIYHVMNQGDRREAIFEDNQDRQRLLETLGQACEKTGWQVHAYCLMRNHFHLVLETPQPRAFGVVASAPWLRPALSPRQPVPAGNMTISLYYEVPGDEVVIKTQSKTLSFAD